MMPPSSLFGTVAKAMDDQSKARRLKSMSPGYAAVLYPVEDKVDGSGGVQFVPKTSIQGNSDDGDDSSDDGGVGGVGGGRSALGAKGVRGGTAVPWRKRFLFCVVPGGKVNQFCIRFLESKRCDVAIVMLIIASSIGVGLENHETRKDVVFTIILFTFEALFTVLFMANAALTVCAYGVRNSLRSGWNTLDFVVVIASILNLSMYWQNNLFVKVARLFRALRPLQLVARSKGMRVIVFALSLSVQAIVNVVAVLLLTWLMFAILGQQLFGGFMHDCSDESFPEGSPLAGVRNASNASLFEVMPCAGSYFDPGEASGAGGWKERQIVPSPSNFDNVGNAMLTLFVMSSLEAWPDVMFRACDITGLQWSRRREANPIAAYYFVMFVAIGVFFFLNLFIGVIYANFAALKEEYRGDGNLTARQKNWLEERKFLTTLTQSVPDPVPRGCRRGIYKLVTHSAFDTSIVACILINMLLMTFVWEGQSQEWVDTLEVLNTIFTAIFTLEAALKITGLGGRGYFKERWNMFDFVIVLFSLVDAVFSALPAAVFRVFRIGRVLGRIFRVLRVSRDFRIIKSLSGLRTLMATLVASLSSLASVGGLIFILFYVFATIGVAFFGEAKFGGAINKHANFQTLGMAFQTLFRMSSGEGWNEIMYAMTDAMGPFSVVYFIFFVLIINFVMVNLFIMIILDNFEQVRRGGYTLVKFYYAWNIVGIFQWFRCFALLVTN